MGFGAESAADWSKGKLAQYAGSLSAVTSTAIRGLVGFEFPCVSGGSGERELHHGAPWMAAVAVIGTRAAPMDCADNQRRPGQPVVVGGLNTLRFGSMSVSPQSGNDLDALVCLVGRGDVDAFAARQPSPPPSRR